MVSDTKSDLRVFLVNALAKDSLSKAVERNDIILIYSNEAHALLAIYGFDYASDRNHFYFKRPIESSRLYSLLSSPGFTNPDAVIKLVQDEWKTLRYELLSSNWEAGETLETLEARQGFIYRIRQETAFLIDGLYTLLKAFNLGRIKHLTSEANQVFKSVLESQSQKSMPIGQAIAEKLIAEQLAQPVTHYHQLSLFEQRMVEAYRKRLHEEGKIQQAFELLSGRAAFSEPIPPDVAHCMVRISTETGYITVCMAHRVANENRDLLFSDHIYVNEALKSAVFVQYKRTEETSKIPAKPNDKQLKGLQEICAHQPSGCTNGRMASTTDMRLGDCMMFYKIIPDDKNSEPGHPLMEGSYLPCCMLRGALQCKAKDPARKQILGRSLNHTTFYSLLRTGQIGNQASQFDYFKDTIAQHFSAPLLAMINENPKTGKHTQP